MTANQTIVEYRFPMPDELEEPSLSKIALSVAAKRYLIKNEQGEVVETPKQWLWRVCSALSDDEVMAQAMYRLMARREYISNTPTMINAGRRNGQEMLHACFVLPVPDELDGIFQTLNKAALIHKTGGGTGYSFGRIRPKNSPVRSTSGVASGPVSFMSIYDSATEHIKQGGARRGANMGILPINHPDILDFMVCKHHSDDAITNFNISVAVDQTFMDAAENGTDYDLIDPSTGLPVDKLNAAEMFDQLVSSAWQNGDPGLVFMDRMNQPRTNPTRVQYGDIEATNPCGEQPLLPYEACVLGSINLERFVDDQQQSFDWDRLRQTIYLAVRFLDNAVERCDYPVAEIAEIVREGNRKIGLGVMGWADALIRLSIPYASEEALELAETTMSFIQSEADNASEALAIERGSFPAWEKSAYGPGGLLGGPDGRPMRNATRTTIAPTGTISIFAGCSSGIEPLFAVAMTRHQADEVYHDVNPIFEEMALHGDWWSPELMEIVAKTGHVQHALVPTEVQAIFPTAHDVTPEWQVRVQAAFQRYVDNAVSKTVNLRNSATVEDVRKVYDLAYGLGCKGITVYRDGSKQTQVLESGTAKTEVDTIDESTVPSARAVLRSVPKSPDGLPARRFVVDTPLGTMNLFVTEIEGEPFELFIVFGKAGQDLTALTEALGRTISLFLRAGLPINLLIQQYEGIGGRQSLGFGERRVHSVVDALAKTLRRHYGTPAEQLQIDDLENSVVETGSKRHVLEPCPECREVAYEVGESCGKCHVCGFANC